jgi:hypothetical protein
MLESPIANVSGIGAHSDATLPLAPLESTGKFLDLCRRETLCRPKECSHLPWESLNDLRQVRRHPTSQSQHFVGIFAEGSSNRLYLLFPRWRKLLTLHLAHVGGACAYDFCELPECNTPLLTETPNLRSEGLFYSPRMTRHLSHRLVISLHAADGSHKRLPRSFCQESWTRG